MRTSGHSAALVRVRRVRAAGPAQRHRRGRRQVRGATIKPAAGQVPDVGAQGVRLCRTVAEQNGVGPEQDEPADGRARVPVGRGNVAGPEHVRSDGQPRRHWRRRRRVRCVGRCEPYKHVRVPEPVHGRLETEKALLLREKRKEIWRLTAVRVRGETVRDSHQKDIAYRYVYRRLPLPDTEIRYTVYRLPAALIYVSGNMDGYRPPLVLGNIRIKL